MSSDDDDDDDQVWNNSIIVARQSLLDLPPGVMAHTHTQDIREKFLDLTASTSRQKRSVGTVFFYFFFFFLFLFLHSVFS